MIRVAIAGKKTHDPTLLGHQKKRDYDDGVRLDWWWKVGGRGHFPVERRDQTTHTHTTRES
jgi:hypothetical protein